MGLQLALALLCSICGAALLLNVPSQAANTIAPNKEPVSPAAPGNLDLPFNPRVEIGGDVRALAIQSDGKILLGGLFSAVNGVPRNNIARINSDGSIDTSFNPSASFRVRSLALQPDGKILLGGDFSAVSGVSRNSIARLNGDGSLDTSFNPGSGGNGSVNALALQADGKVLVGGGFTTINGVNRNRIARLNSDGSLDTSFNPGTGADSLVDAIALQPDGKVLIGGLFTAVNGVTRNHIARLNSDGSLDTAFNPGTNSNTSVSALKLQVDGKILLGGNFNTVNGVSRTSLARIDNDGNLDAAFNPSIGVNGNVNAILVQPDGKILLAGFFFSINGVSRDSIGRINSDGSLDNAFNPGSGVGGNAVFALALQTNEQVLLGGNFTGFNGMRRNGIARLENNGGLDAAFGPNPGVNSDVSSLALQSDGKILLGGDFTIVNGVTRNRIARLNNDGSLDLSFNPGTGANLSVNAVTLQSDGKILLGGIFSTVNGVSRNRIARLNNDGSLDTSFVTSANLSVDAVTLQSDGKILLGGGFTTVNGVSRNRIARLNSEGSLDLSFNPGTGADSSVFAVAEQPDGKIIIGGQFDTFNGLNRGGIVRLNIDGSVDHSFNPGSGADLSVVALALQPDGKVLLAGNFITFNGVSRNGLARLNNDGSLDNAFGNSPGPGTSVTALLLQWDGKILIGGNFFTVNGVSRRGIALLNGDSSLDIAFNPGTGVSGGFVGDFALQSDGKILFSGSFDTFNGIERIGLARLLAVFTISGRITDAANMPLSNVPITLTGTNSRVILTDNNGNYLFNSLPAGGNYTVIPNNAAYVFNPLRADFTGLTSDRIQNFVAQPNIVPLPTPPLMDMFPPRPNPDPTIWNPGILSEAPGSLDPAVTVAQTTGQLVITPRSGMSGSHFNGYVAVNSFDFTNGELSVELVQAGTGGSQSIFSMGTDFQNFTRFLVQSPLPGATLTIQEVINGEKQTPFETTMTMLMFQLVQNGQVFLNVAIPYDPVAHRFLRFRHVTRDANQNPINSIAFETSPDATVWTERARGDLGERSVQAITVELAGGTSAMTGSPGPIIFDNLATQILNCRFTNAGLTVNEGDGQVTLTVTRAGLTNLPASVEYSTVDGTASQRSRYVAAAGLLSFAPGETSKTLQILLVDDALVQGTQTFNVFLGPAFGMGINGPGRTIVTINDNDNPPITTNPLETPGYFVTRQYYDFLSRVPDASGLDYWAGQITQCGNNTTCISARRWQVSLAFFVELEFQQTGAYVYRLYRAAYGNNQPFPNPSGNADSHPYCMAQGCPFRAEHIPSYQRFVLDRARVVGSQNLPADQLALAAAFVNRAEFRQRYPTTLTGPQFVDAVLATVQAASNVNLTGQRDALIALHGTGGRGAVMYRLADDNIQSNPINNRAYIDAEYNRGFVLTQYFGYLRRDPDQPGLNFWLATVNRFPVRDLPGQNAMVCAFVTSQEYQERFSLISPRNNGECPPAP